MAKEKVEVPIITIGEEQWLQLKHLSKTGKLRAATINKKRHVPDPDGHHCEEVSVQGSIRYHPRTWKIL